MSSDPEIEVYEIAKQAQGLRLKKQAFENLMPKARDSKQSQHSPQRSESPNKKPLKAQHTAASTQTPAPFSSPDEDFIFFEDLTKEAIEQEQNQRYQELYQEWTTLLEPKLQNTSELNQFADNSLDKNKDFVKPKNPNPEVNTAEAPPLETIKPENIKKPPSSANASPKSQILLKIETNALEVTLETLLGGLFKKELSFLEPIPCKDSLDLANGRFEKIHQKLLFFLDQGQTIHEKTYQYLGFYYFMENRVYEGVRLIEPFSSHAQDKAFFYNLLGNFYYQLGLLDKAKTWIQQSIDQENSLVSAYLSLGYLCMESGDLDQGYRHLTVAEKSFLDNATFLRCMGRYCEQKNWVDQGLFYYEKYYAKYPDEKVLTQLINLSYQAFQLKKTLKYILENEQASQDSRLDLKNIDYKKAICQYFIQDKYVSLQALKTLIGVEEDPQNLPVNTPKDPFLYRELLREYLKAYRLGLYDIWTFKIFEDLSEKLSFSYEDFIDEDIEIEKIERWEVLLFIAKQLLKRKKYLQSQKYLKKVLEIKKDSIAAIRELSKIKYSQDPNNPKALQWFKELDIQKETDGQIDYYLGLEKKKAQDWPAAQLYMSRAERKGFQSPSLKKHLGEAYVQLKDYEKAKQCLTVALKENKNSIESCLLLGEVYMAQKDYQKAILIFKQVLNQEKDNKQAHLKLSKTYRTILESESEEHYWKYAKISHSTEENQESK